MTVSLSAYLERLVLDEYNQIQRYLFYNNPCMSGLILIL